MIKTFIVTMTLLFAALIFMVGALYGAHSEIQQAQQDHLTTLVNHFNLATPWDK